MPEQGIHLMNSTAAVALPPRSLVLAAFAAIYLIWGSTYLAIRVAVETLPPFLMAGARFVLAGAVLLALVRARRVPWPTPRQWRNAVVAGTFMLLGGNGLVVWAEQQVPSSLAALFIATAPVWFALIDWLRPGGAPPARRIWLGIGVGFVGVALLVYRPAGSPSDVGITTSGTLALLAATICWAGGSIFARHSAKAESPWMNSAMQMLGGGVALTLTGLAGGEWPRILAAHISSRSMLAFLYLVVFGSWIAYSAYVWLLKVSTPARVSTYAYVNPVIAVLLGWAFLREPVTPRMLGAAVIIMAAVVIITLPGEIWSLSRWRRRRAAGGLSFNRHPR
jgi:drug/metabolite transporter (DMT)-like permease